MHSNFTKVRASYSQSINFFEGISPLTLVEQFGSPLYVYNENILRERCQDLCNLVKLPNFKVSYSPKANANPHLLKIIRSEGLMVDSMSLGELALVKQAGFSKDEIIYVCNNVSAEELSRAAKHTALVSIDSLDQLRLFGESLPQGRVMLRLNPGIGAGHHQKVITAGADTKFGINLSDFEEIQSICKTYQLQIIGLNQHIGSLFLDGSVYLKACAWLLEAALKFENLRILDFGGGFGIPYQKYAQEERLKLEELGAELTNLLGNWQQKHNYTGLFYIEPGRYISAECGLLLGTVHALKTNGQKNYACTDLGFNVLHRPIIYDAFHDLEIYRKANKGPVSTEEIIQSVVGNICESGDILAKERLLPKIEREDILGVLDAGAYAHSMSSNYNQRLRPAEILITKGEVKLIRRRDRVEDLLNPYINLD